MILRKNIEVEIQVGIRQVLQLMRYRDIDDVLLGVRMKAVKMKFCRYRQQT